MRSARAPRRSVLALVSAGKVKGRGKREQDPGSSVVGNSSRLASTLSRPWMPRDALRCPALTALMQRPINPSATQSSRLQPQLVGAPGPESRKTRRLLKRPALPSANRFRPADCRRSCFFLFLGTGRGNVEFLCIFRNSPAIVFAGRHQANRWSLRNRGGQASEQDSRACAGTGSRRYFPDQTPNARWHYFVSSSVPSQHQRICGTASRLRIHRFETGGSCGSRRSLVPERANPSSQRLPCTATPARHHPGPRSRNGQHGQHTHHVAG
jgi:hypothetical protein